MSEYNVDERCETGIWTHEDHRQRGLALATATAVIDQAIAVAISNIGWHCWASNAPSIATARKLGFTLAVNYPVYFAYIEQQLNLAVNGNMCLNAGDTQQALDWFTQAEYLGELPAWAVEQMAQARELSGERAGSRKCT